MILCRDPPTDPTYIPIKKEFQMSQNKQFQWHILDSLFERTNSEPMDHKDTNPETIKQQLKFARQH
jgi:hypothetical protein